MNKDQIENAVVTFIEEGNPESLFDESKYASKIDKVIDMLYNKLTPKKKSEIKQSLEDIKTEIHESIHGVLEDCLVEYNQTLTDYAAIEEGKTVLAKEWCLYPDLDYFNYGEFSKIRKELLKEV